MIVEYSKIKQAFVYIKRVHVKIFISKATYFLQNLNNNFYADLYPCNVPTFGQLYAGEHSDSNAIAHLNFAVVIKVYIHLNADVVVILASYTLVMMTVFNLAAFYSL